MRRKYVFRKYKNLVKRKGIFGDIEKNMLGIGLIYLKRNKKITKELIDRLKLDISRDISKVIIKIKPNKVLTSKGILIRMGKGKGKIQTTFIYGTKGLIIMEIITFPPINFYDYPITEVNQKINKFLKKYTFLKIKWI